jgi:Ca-activated chloride channel family protein
VNTALSISEPETTFSSNPSHGGRLVSTDGRTLPLRGASLHTEARGGIARVILEQRFENPYAEPLTVTYSLPLPADAAVSGFSFRIGERRVVGEIDGRKAARERFEQALSEGRSAALLEQDRSSLFTQEIGNIPPGEAVICELILDQRLRWLDEGAWEWRFPTVVAPRYLGSSGRVVDAERVAQDIASGPLPVRMSLACVIRDTLARGRRAESPSHPLLIDGEPGAQRVSFADGGARLDRDVVLRWAVGEAKVGLSLDLGRPPADRASAVSTYGLLTVVPPQPGSPARAVCRDLIVLLDTSGSMGGEPLNQARRVVTALIDSLRDEDQLELIEFSSRARRWKPGPVSATLSARRDALDWLARLRASGSTEMRDGILEAMRALRPESQRQVILITDGMIGFESEVVAAVCDRLPASSRLHTVGVGSSINRSLTGPASRAGRGVEVIIGLGEDPERAAARLLARTRSPILVELELSGSALVGHAPRYLPDLFAGAPALIGVALRPEGGELRLRGRTAEGSWEQRMNVSAQAPDSGNPAAATLFGREAVEDLELRLAAGGSAREIDPTIERFGIDFQIATRLTSWIAVTQEATVDPRDPLRRERMPHELAYGLSAEGVGLRAAQAAAAPMSLGGFGAPATEEVESTLVNAAPAAAFVHLVGDIPPHIPVAGPLGYGAPPPASKASAPAAPPPPPARPSAVMRRLATPPAPEAGPTGPSQGEASRSRGAPPPPPARNAPASPMAKKEAASDRGAEDAKVEAPREKGGLIESVKRFFGAGKDQPSEPAPARQESTAAAKGDAPALRTLRGRIVVRKHDELVLEIEVKGAPFDWDPACQVDIVLDDGRRITVGVIAARSTRPGALSLGTRLRVALPLPAGVDPDAIRTFVLRRDGAEGILVTL